MAKAYPNDIPKVSAFLEFGAALGVAFGPIVGALWYTTAGFTGPFLFMTVCFLLWMFSIIVIVPSSLVETEGEKPEVMIGYSSLLSHR